MARPQKQKTKQKKNIKKSFYEVTAPLTSTNIQLYASAPEELVGKFVKIDLTKNLRGKSLELKLRIKQEGDNLIAEPEMASLAISYIRRVMRKSADYSEDSFETECRDSIVRVKPLLVTRKRVSRAVLKALRETSQKELKTYLKTRTSKEIFTEITTNKLQKQLAQKLKKIYPLSLCEIRVFKVLKFLDAPTKQENKKESKITKKEEVQKEE